MKATKWCALILGVALSTACTGRFPNAQRTLLSVAGYGVSLEVLQSSASAPETPAGSEATVGKWASQAKRGTNQAHGIVAPPGPPPTSWTAVTGGAGVITVTRFDPIPAGATGVNYRAIDTTTGLVFSESGSIVGAVSGRAYKVQAAWWNGANRVSDYSQSVTVNAG